jgi:hypothetical protein
MLPVQSRAGLPVPPPPIESPSPVPSWASRPYKERPDTGPKGGVVMGTSTWSRHPVSNRITRLTRPGPQAVRGGEAAGQGLEPRFTASEAAVLPLDDPALSFRTVPGNRTPSIPGWKPGAPPVGRARQVIKHPAVEKVGIEPTTSTLARRDRSHSCHPR